MVANVVAESSDDFQTTIPARKLLDICKALPDGSVINFNIEDTRVSLTSGRSRFTLATLSAQDFPSLDEIEVQQSFPIRRNNSRIYSIKRRSQWRSKMFAITSMGY